MYIPHYFFQGASFSNVIGVKKGANFGKSSDKVLMLLAHYDTVDTTKGKNIIIYISTNHFANTRI